MDNVTLVVNSGFCTGCAACGACEHIEFRKNKNGVPVPVIDTDCIGCGNCLRACIYDPKRQEDDDE